MILLPSDTGGKKVEIRNRAMSGLGACWAALGQENMGRQGRAGLQGTIIVIYIHTHAPSRRVVDG